VYDREITKNQVLTFGVSGMLYRNGLVMYDRETRSLWSQILGRAISGDYITTQLVFIPAMHTDWQTWKNLHPDTKVIQPGLYGNDPYASYYKSQAEGVVGEGLLGGGLDRGSDIYPKEYVLGVRLNGEEKAYPFSVLNKKPVINDTVGGVPVAIFFDKETLSGTVFDRRTADDTVLTFSPVSTGTVQDSETGSRWQSLSGTAIDGSLANTSLAAVPFTYAFYFGWIDYHPDSQIYKIPPQ